MQNAYDILLLIGAGVFAGFVNTIAGGGSLLTLPLLIFMGLPPAVANGTNRIAIVVATLSANIGYASKKVVTYPFSIYLGISSLLGAILGARIAIEIDGAVFNRILAIIMIMVVLIMVFKPKMGISSAIKVAGKRKQPPPFVYRVHDEPRCRTVWYF